MNLKSHDASIRETVIATIREYRRSLKRLMSIQHRASKPLRREVCEVHGWVGEAAFVRDGHRKCTAK